MKKLVLLFSLMCCLQCSSEREYTHIKNAFKNISFKKPDGTLFTNENLKNKVTFINFWFERCPPCLAEFDALNGLYNKYKDNKDFQFISFTYESEEDIDRIAKAHHLNYPIAHSDQEKIQALISGYPTNIITDQAGEIALIKSGVAVDKDKINKEFDNVYSKKVERLLFAQKN